MGNQKSDIACSAFLNFSFLLLSFRLASISALKFEVSYKGKIKTGIGKIMSLSIETKVAIAVATSFVLLVVGAMAQG
jgi:hypothetical protein